MRPLELRLKNFRSYHGDDHVVDFRGRRLLAIVGPTGAGKSTLLDAITFALYGRTVRVGRATSTLINQRCEEAAVSLRFEVDGITWEAARRIRRAGTNEHALYRYPDGEGKPESVGVMEREVNDQVEALLGLDFEAFSRSVLLAQGRFAEFLEAGPAERDKVLKGVFGFERVGTMQELAKEWAAQEGNKIEVLKERQTTAQHAATRGEELRRQLQSAQERKTKLDEALPAFTALEDEMAQVSRAGEDQRKRLKEIEYLGKRLPDRRRSNKIIKEAEQAGSRLAELRESVKAAVGRREKAEAELQSPQVKQRLQNRDEASRLVVQWEHHVNSAQQASRQAKQAQGRQEGCSKELAEAENARKSAQETLESTEKALKDAQADQQKAEDGLWKARHADMAAVLRGGLDSGQECPVCEQPVHELPAPISDTGASEAEAQVKQAKQASQATQKAHTKAASDSREAQARFEEAGRRQEEADKQAKAAIAEEASQSSQLEKCLAALVKILGEGDPHQLLEAEKAALDQLDAAVVEASQAERQARDAEAKSDQEGQAARAGLGNLRDQLAKAAGVLGLDVPSASDDPTAVGTLWENISTEQKTLKAELVEAIEKGGKQEAEVRTRQELLRVKYELEKSVQEDLATAQERSRGLSKEIENAEKMAAGLDEVSKQIADLEQSLEFHQRLASDLTNSKFVRFLLDTERINLSDIGSDHFQRLSSGRYRFTEDGKFEVVDLAAAGETRRSDSLSGGETFLASLGLALALAEMVSRGGGRLDAFMLDEGFGTLDPEHLDLAMEGIESLVADSDHRLVMVVSHVAELRERVEDLIVLDKDPLTGSSHFLQGATPT